MSHWRPSSSAAVARRRAAMLARVRDYFAARDVLAVDTPALSRFATVDANIDSIGALLMDGTRAYLHTSPESAMKRLLAGGYPDIYSICRVFRDDERGRQHALEFTMIEWYRLGFGLRAIIDDTTGLIAACLQQPAMHDAAVVFDYGELFTAVTGLDVATASIEQLAGVVSADAELRRSMGADRQGWIDLVMAMSVAPTLPGDRLTVLQHYPREQAALARICPANTGVADRFEVFYGTLELANGYVELTDATEQRRRFEAELARRRALGKPAPGVDEPLLAALESGLPECAGVALGFERLHMLYEQTGDIDNVLSISDREDR